MNCPNCNSEFVELRETAYFCEQCGWFTQVDGKWHTCPEPVKPAEPAKPAEPVRPAEPSKPAEPIPEPVDQPEPEPVRSTYLGGLITVTEVDDAEDDEQ